MPYDSTTGHWGTRMRQGNIFSSRRSKMPLCRRSRLRGGEVYPPWEGGQELMYFSPLIQKFQYSDAKLGFNRYRPIIQKNL
jgi:hypothetical protein